MHAGRPVEIDRTDDAICETVRGRAARCGRSSALSPRLRRARLRLAPAWQAALPPHSGHARPCSRWPCSAPTTAAPLPAKYKDVQEKIGLLFNLRARTVCTAFCVRQGRGRHRRPLPARHAGERPPQLADFWFARNYDAVRDYRPHRRPRQRRGRAARDVGRDEPERAPADRCDARTGRWCGWRGRSARKGVLPVRVLPIEQIMTRGQRQARVPGLLPSRLHALEARLLAALRRGARASRPRTGSTIAQDFSEPDALILHTCDTGGASSGSPLLLDTPTAGPR